MIEPSPTTPMSSLDAVILGLIQGFTEFLPVSSSGHLVLAQELLEVKQAGVSFEVLLHLGTLLSIMIYFRKQIMQLGLSLIRPQSAGTKENRSVVFMLLVGSLPAAFVGLSLKEYFEQAFSSPLLTAWMLIVTGFILLSTRLVKTGDNRLNHRSALAIGLGQAIAIMPGISRSGTTIAIGMLFRVKPSRAAEFSFLLALPAIGGAALLQIGELAELESAFLGSYLVGALVAFLSGLLAVNIVLGVIRRGRFDYFAYYCFAAGGAGLYLFR